MKLWIKTFTKLSQKKTKRIFLKNDLPYAVKWKKGNWKQLLKKEKYFF